MDAVAIRAPAGRAPSIEAVLDFGNVTDGDVLGQDGQETALKHGWTLLELGLEADDLTPGMHASVRTSGEINDYLLLSYAQQGFLQHTLNRAQAGLRLKPVKVRAVVLDQQS